MFCFHIACICEKNYFSALRYCFILICQAFCADSSVKCNDMAKVLTRSMSTLTAKSFLEIREGSYYWSSSTRIFLFRSRERWTVLLTKKVAHPRVCYHYSGEDATAVIYTLFYHKGFAPSDIRRYGNLIVRKCFRAKATYCTSTGRDTLLPSLSVMRAM